MWISNRIVHNTWLNQFRDPKKRRFWLLSGVATFLHTAADPISTYVTIVIFEIGYESNPMLATPLNQSLAAFVVAHIPLWIISIGVIFMFANMFEKSSVEKTEKIIYYGEYVWLGIILWGILVVGNNMFVLASGILNTGL